MSKFTKNKIKGSQNIQGDNNYQDNSKTTNNFYPPSEPSKRQSHDWDAGTIMWGSFILLMGLLILVWKYNTYIVQVYRFVNISILLSSTLMIVAVVILWIKNELIDRGVIYFVSSLVFSFLLYTLLTYTQKTISVEIVQLARENSLIDFWGGLEPSDKDLAVANIVSVALIGIATLLNHLISFRQLAYSLASKESNGIWYNAFDTLWLFKLKISGSAIILLVVGTMLVSNGIFPNFQ